MRRFEKRVALCLCLCLLAAALAGCGNRGAGAPEAAELNVYATFYPVYALARMAADGVPDLTLRLLVQPQDGCPRAYALSDWDAALLSSADAVIALGEGFESFAGALAAHEGERPAVAELLPGMELIECEAANADPDRDSHWDGANPHAYMSVDGALEIVGRAAHSMAALDPDYEALYMENLGRATERLEALRAEIAAEAAGLAGARAAILNEALVYSARDYGLDAALCWARESGESMDDGALEELLSAMAERDIRVALIERQAPQRLLEALEGAGISVAALDVLSTHRESEGVEAYFEALRSNAAAVRDAFARIHEEDE